MSVFYCEMSGLDYFNEISWYDEPEADGVHGIIPDVSTCFMNMIHLCSNCRQGLP